MNRAAFLHGYKPSPAGWVGDGLFDVAKAAKTQASPVRVDKDGKRTIVSAALTLPVLDQGALGTCETHSHTSGLAMLMPKPMQLSRLDLYYKCRTFDGSFPRDEGTTAATVAHILKTVGICTEDQHPYDGSPPEENERLNLRPSDLALQSGYDHRIDATHVIVASDAAEMEAKGLASLRAGRPFEIGGPVSQGFCDYFNDLQPSEPGGGLVAFGEMRHSIGGHSQLCVGAWELADGVIWLIRGSWGASGGLREFPGHSYLRTPALLQCDERASIFRAPTV